MRFPYIKAMHNALRQACPEGYSVSVVRHQRHLVTVIECADSAYFPRWSVREIVEQFGFRK